jgi:hypothetical protein
MSTLLLKHLQEPGLDELKNRSHIITRERRVSRRVIPALSLGVFGIFAIRGFNCPVSGLTGDAVNEFFLKLIGAFLKKIMHALPEWLFHALP